VNRGLGLALLWPALVGAWEEEPALGFIVAHSPLLQAQRAVVASYQPPSTLRRVLEHTSVYVRAASGTSSTVADSGDTTTSAPMTVGIQVNIPLSSPREQREFAQQALADLLADSSKECVVDKQRIREMRHAAGVRYFDFTPVLIVALASVIGARYLAIGTGDTELYIFAGMLAAVVLSVRVFLFRGAGRVN
jgi:hypothetical protein